MRKRNNEIHIMLSDEEYANFNELLKMSGLNKRQFILNAISGSTFITAEYLEELQKLNALIDKFNELIKRTGVNINQLAKVANTDGSLPTLDELRKLSNNIAKIREGTEKIWQYTRLLVQKVLEPMEH